MKRRNSGAGRTALALTRLRVALAASALSDSGREVAAPHLSPNPPDGLWLFDGVCNFCSGSVQVALKLDRRGVMRFTPLQSPFGRAIAAKYGLDVENPDSFLFFDQGRPLDASDAVLALARRLGPPWSLFAALRVIPKSWRDAAYLLLARNRYRLMGKKAACMVPTPEQRARFILDPPPGWA
jgi:predicted DCC family thiol-disulfide oxidoreductase YuxK